MIDFDGFLKKIIPFEIKSHDFDQKFHKLLRLCQLYEISHYKIKINNCLQKIIRFY